MEDNTFKFKLGNIVVLKTKIYEDDELNIIKDLSTFRKKNTILIDPFNPPYMVVIEMYNKNQPQSERSGTNTNLEKLVSQSFAKCMWYNHDSGKFSEREFPIECLELAENTDSKLSQKRIIKKILGYSILGITVVALFFKK